MSTPKKFEVLDIPQKELTQAKASRYRIYTTESDYQVVIAETAAQAFETSGLKQALKIERENIDSESVLKEGELVATPGAKT